MIVIAALPLRAQSSGSAPPLWSGKAEISFVAATGNSDTQTIGGGAEFEHRLDRRDELVRVNFVRSADRDGLKAESLLGLARASYPVTPRVDGFGEFEYLRNRFAGIVDRYNLSAGLTYRVLPDPGPHVLLVFASLGYLREKDPGGDDQSAAAVHGGVRYRWQLSDRGEIVDELQLVDTVETDHEWRAVQMLSVTAGLNSAVSVKLSQRIEYLRRPVPGFRPTDTLTSAALVVKF